MPAERKIRLLVADDQEMVRLGVKALLAGTEIEVVAEAATGQAAIKLALEKDVDLVLLDVLMPDGDGLMVLDRIKLDKPNLPVLLFSAFDNFASVARAIALGARGFLLKGCSRDEFLNAIRIVGHWRAYLEPREAHESGPFYENTAGSALSKPRWANAKARYCD